MSLSGLSRKSEEGVEFRSHIDGKKYFLSPEYSIKIQKTLGSDIIMCFDDCASFQSKKNDVANSMKRSLEWALRSKEEFGLTNSGILFGIQQGALFEWLTVSENVNFGLRMKDVDSIQTQKKVDT